MHQSDTVGAAGGRTRARGGGGVGGQDKRKAEIEMERVTAFQAIDQAATDEVQLLNDAGAATSTSFWTICHCIYQLYTALRTPYDCSIS